MTDDAIRRIKMRLSWSCLMLGYAHALYIVKREEKKQHGATQSFLDAHMYFRSHFQALKKGNKRTFLTAVVFMRFRQTSMTHTLNSSVIPPVLFVTFFLTLQHPFPPHWG